MNVGEFYRNRFNHYVSQVTNVTDKIVTLTNIQGVSDCVRIENFHTNWSKVNNIFQFETTIRNQFPDDFTIKYSANGESIIAEYEYGNLLYSAEFSIQNLGECNERFCVLVTDALKALLGLYSNSMDYKLEDALDAICMIADQL